MTDAEIDTAQDARVPYLEPRSLGDADGRLVRLPARVPLARSYATQEHTTLVEGGRHVLCTTRAVARLPIRELDRTTRWLVTAWNARGERCTLRENVAAHERLRVDLEHAGAQVLGAVVTTPPDRAWAEDTWLVGDLDADLARALA